VHLLDFPRDRVVRKRRSHNLGDGGGGDRVQLDRGERSGLDHGEPGKRKWERDGYRGGDRQHGDDEPDGNRYDSGSRFHGDAGGGAGAVQLRDFADGGLTCSRWWWSFGHSDGGGRVRLERWKRGRLDHGEPGEREWERDRCRDGGGEHGDDEPDGDGDDCGPDLRGDAGGGAGAVQLHDSADGGLARGRW